MRIKRFPEDDGERLSEMQLYKLWLRFRNNPDAAQILADFAVTDRETARELIREFRIAFYGFEAEQELPPAKHNKCDFEW